MNHNETIEVVINARTLVKAMNLINRIDRDSAESPVIHIKEKDRATLEDLAHILWDVNYALHIHRAKVSISREEKR